MTEAKKYRSGESGLNVYGAQQRLRTLGYDVALTSVMDSKTVAAVKEIQTLIGGYPYACLDYGTMEGLERLFQEYVNGSGEDLQLQKAVEYLAGRIGSSD
jgi:carboxyl-terminal processing protease